MKVSTVDLDPAKNVFQAHGIDEAGEVVVRKELRPHNWERFSFGAWLERAAQRMHKNKLATALANKLARIAWRMLRHQRPFDTHRHQLAAV